MHVFIEISGKEPSRLNDQVESKQLERRILVSRSYVRLEYLSTSKDHGLSWTAGVLDICRGIIAREENKAAGNKSLINVCGCKFVRKRKN